MKLGIIREGKTPPDSRVPLTPKQCAQLVKEGVDLVVQRSPGRCYTDEEYKAEGITLVDTVNDRDVVLGVKEVPIDQLIPSKKYFFFSHTIKAQPYNRDLLQAILAKNIHLHDWEVLTNDSGARVIAFGRFAGIVGAHNGMLTYGLRTGEFELEPAHETTDMEAMFNAYRTMQLPRMRVVVTGGGRVAGGSVETLEAMGVKRVDPADYLNNKYDHAIYTQLNSEDLYFRKDGSAFDLQHFYNNPADYDCDLSDYYRKSDVFVNAVYWDPAAPAYFSQEQMNEEDFRISVIADITCDIAPEASVPSTIRPSTIDDPYYGFDPATGEEIEPFSKDGIDVMAIDNLPNELPRDASQAFGEQFMEFVLPELLKENSGMMERASIAINGKLGPHFQYLQDYVDDK